MKNILERGKTLLRSRTRLVRGLGVAAAVLIFTIGTAKALFQLRVTASGGGSVLVTDNGVGDLNPLPGVIAFSGAVGDFTVNTITGLSKPILGSPNTPHTDLNSVNVTATSGGTILIELTDTGFTDGGPVLASHVGGTIINGTVSFDAWAGGSNVEFAHAGAHTHMGPFGPISFSGDASALGVTGNPFAMTAQASATFGTNGGTMSWDFDNQVIPEGSSLAMLLPGLAPLGLILRRRMKKA